jgi:hypothetical protein
MEVAAQRWRSSRNFLTISWNCITAAKSLRGVRLVYCDGDLVDLLYGLIVSLATIVTAAKLTKSLAALNPLMMM